MSDLPTIHEMALGGLLHDIGKLMQRAGVPLSPEGRVMHQVNDDYFHAHYSQDFLEKHLAKYLPAGVNSSVTAQLATSHHSRSASGCARLLQLADRASAAFDRPEVGELGAGWKSQRLLAPFADVNAPEPRNSFCKLMPLSFDSASAFPETETEPYDRTGEYAALWNEFLTALPSLVTTSRNPDIWLGAFSSILERFTWCVPSYTQSRHADISLFDHAFTTAGIACSLYQYHVQTQSWKEQSLNDTTTKRLRIVAGDVSGIQRFIQNIPTRHQKDFHLDLRARSFVIGLLADVVLHQVLQAVGLPRVCLWMRYGGKFTILAPNTPDLPAKIGSIQRSMDQWLLDALFGELRLHLDCSLEVALEDFNRPKFPVLLSSIAAHLAQSKKRAFSSVLTKDGAWDANAFINSIKADEHTPFEETDALPYRTIGRALLQQPLVISYLPAGSRGTIQIAGTPVELSSQAPADAVYAESVNVQQQGLPVVYMANHVCREHGAVVSFQSLSGAKQEDKHGMLFLLKGDVDGLGKVFGDPDKADSLSRYLFRSRMLHYYFAGHLSAVLKEKYQRFYTVYAGGDDFFLIAPLKGGLEAMVELRKAFTLWTSAALSFSAAAAPYKTNTPLRNGFRLAEEWLTENAKQAQGKDRCVAYHTVVTWDVLEHLLQLGQSLERWLDDKWVNTLFLQRLLRYRDMHLRAFFSDPADVNALLYKARLRYDIRRNVARNVPREQRTGIQNQCLQALEGGGRLHPDTVMTALRIPVSNIIYQQRSEK